jgi:hypothetical protein
MKRILFITSTNLTTNPRLLKELQLAIDQGHSAVVIKFNLSNWSQDFEKETESLFKSVRFIELSALRHPFFSWLISLLLEQACRLIPSVFLSAKQLSFAVGKRSYLILKCIKKLNQNFDLIVAHNPQSFYPALVASKKFNGKLGIDIEDYHPGETNNKSLCGKTLLLLKHTLPEANYISYASPCFYDIVNQKISLKTIKQIVLLNGFPSSDFTLKNSNTTKLSLVWFSQHINGGRGLEPLLDAMADFNDQVELHLIGQLNTTFGRNFIKGKKNIHIHAPKPQSELHEFLCDFDIGVACDVPLNSNRDLALTNKLIVYAQAGLFILATHTTAQDKFLQESALEYVQVKPDIDSYKNILLTLISKKIEIENNRVNRFDNGLKFCWDEYSMLFKKIIV